MLKWLLATTKGPFRGRCQRPFTLVFATVEHNKKDIYVRKYLTEKLLGLNLDKYSGPNVFFIMKKYSFFKKASRRRQLKPSVH